MTTSVMARNRNGVDLSEVGFVPLIGPRQRLPAWLPLMTLAARTPRRGSPPKFHSLVQPHVASDHDPIIPDFIGRRGLAGMCIRTCGRVWCDRRRPRRRVGRPTARSCPLGGGPRLVGIQAQPMHEIGGGGPRSLLVHFAVQRRRPTRLIPFSTDRLIHGNVGSKQYSCGTVDGLSRGLTFV
jgi:hypothetical protein